MFSSRCVSGSVGDDAVVLNDVSGRRRDLEKVLPPAAVAALLALPRRLAAASGDDDRGDGGTGDYAAKNSGGGTSAMAITSVLIRRYRSENHRPCFQFHTDDHSCTVSGWSPTLPPRCLCR